ncbi:hypothetical protein DID88_007820 [Monilinia fructigena]|uniref:K Homology domain-containing protein n=1 Tax=Monilinia fructigena TaxID=38457 RepID=A0A395J3J1_9HELO|nr:hypothetical protein DID88_007820 [Monilinia fructigena]
MSAVDTAVPNGHSEANGNGPELSQAQKLMLKHDQEHQPTIEEIPDEEDLKHGEQPIFTSVLEDANGDSTAPGRVPSTSTKAAGKQKESSINTQSYEAFPALGATSHPKPQVQGFWGGGKPSANLNGTPTNAYGSASAARTGIKALMEQIGKKSSAHSRKARAFIIGKQGSKIKELQEATGARIQIPKDDKPGLADDDEDSTVDVKVAGNVFSIAEARKAIEKIVGEKVGTTKTKVHGIPSEFYTFLAADADSLRNTHNLSELEIPSNYILPNIPRDSEAPLFVPAAANNYITLNGDRAAVLAARAELERRAQQYHQELTRQQLKGISKGRHQFILGDQGNPGQDFFAKTGCAIFVPSETDEDEAITIVGPADKIKDAIREARKQAMATQTVNIDIHKQLKKSSGNTTQHAQNLARYLRERDEIERLEKLFNARIFTPKQADVTSPWEVYSRDQDSLFDVQEQLISMIDAHPHSRMANIPVDPFYHSHLRKEISPRVKQDYGVHVVIPELPDGDVLLVFEGIAGREPEYSIPRSQPSRNDVEEFKRGLADARKHILDIIGSQAEVTSESIDVPAIYHDKLRRFILQENKSNQIPVRAYLSGTVITLKGPKPTVESLAAKVRDFVAHAIEEEKERGYTISFDFPQKHANQLIVDREKFDVDIQLTDGGQVEVKGPKAKADAAKSHISSLGKQWADETTYILKIDPKFHPELIGAKGNQINRLQDRYKVLIHFPRSARPTDDENAGGEAGQQGTRRQQAPDEVSIKGPKKGADEARDEILSLFQYLQDNAHSATVSVQQSQIPSLIGQRGAGMEELRQLTGAKIDVPNSRDSADASGRVEIQIKGTASQVAKAKKLIEEKKSVFDSTVTESLNVEKKHHRALIGAGGANIHSIIINAGGSGDRRELARVVQFPKAESDGNTIKVEGSGQTGITVTGLPADVEKAKAHILELVKGQEGETVQVPRKLHNDISNNVQFFRKLRNDLGVTVDHAGAKLPARVTPPPGASAKDALITDEKDTSDDVEEWFVFNKSDSGEPGDIPWVLRGRTENIEQAKSLLAQAIEQASKNNFVGYLSLVDPSLYGSVVGKNGSKVNSIREATGCNVTVPRGQGTDPIEVVGSEEGIERAKELILQAVAEGKNKPARGGDRY